MSELTLYLTPGTCAMAVRIALVEAGAPHQIRRVDFASGEQRSPAYLAINPKGRVPALVTERGVLTETPALLLYVAQRFPDAKLAPLNDPFLLARMQEVNSFLASTVHVAHAHSRRAARWADDEQAIAAMQAKVPRNMRDGFSQIENNYLAGPWVLGEQFSLADIYLFVVASWLEGDRVTISEFPKVADHYRRMLARPGVQQGLAL
ncbi:glutathione S-transferase family protein [Aeromonas sp. CD]|uniref:glutathione S-transferase family protein n=1 Tax=Aeromonas sp. CD TaxID=3080830 RepID=UPI00296624BD|nr:glutathione S-transferase family protein [Aeromonas sp. CD]WOX54624.1 glutathione S-transferase family protein [Aeromonas sp. CD]